MRPSPLLLSAALSLVACLGPTFPPQGQPIEVDTDADFDGLPRSDSALPRDSGPVADAGRDGPASSDAGVVRDGPTSSESGTSDRTSNQGPDGSAASSLFGFENAAPDWRSDQVMLTRDSMKVSEGSASLMFVAKGYVKVQSRSFDTTELSTVLPRLSLDVYLTSPEGNLSITFECQTAKLGATNIGQRPFTGLSLESWTTVAFTLPPQVVVAMLGKHTGCKLWLEHNGTGVTRYDRMTFVQ